MKWAALRLAATLTALLPPGLAHAAWTKTYVVEWNEPADYYGAKAGTIEPGTDCPKGTNPEPDWVKILVEAGYTPEEARWLRNPANPTRSPIHGQNQMAFRGKDRANVYIHPTSTPETGLVGVTGTIAEGLDLDGNPRTGFTSPTGEPGIDNNFYRTLGCWKPYRGPPRLSSGALSMNDAMREGSWTVVVVVAGAGSDPANDPDVSVGFYMGQDKLVKDGTGSVVRDYTFRIRPDAELEAIFKAKSAGGVITSTVPAREVWLRDPSYTRQLQLLQARIRLQMQPDGSLKGLIGGYRPWLPIYTGWVDARGPVIEAVTWVRLPDVYYALQRGADYSPTGAGGEKTHISYAMRVEAIPAFVVSPDGKTEVRGVTSYKAQANGEVAPVETILRNFNIVDGIVVPPGGTATSLPAQALLPPKSEGIQQP
jgi:hypothetical protein